MSISKSDPMELPVCSICLIPDIKIIEHYNHKQYLFSRSQELYNKKLHLCTECVVGKKVPLFRKRQGIWDDVKIISYDDQTYEHRILFSNGYFDSVILNSRPFEAYYSHLRRETNRYRSQEHDSPMTTSQQSTHELKEYVPTAIKNSMITSHKNVPMKKKQQCHNPFQASSLPIIELSGVCSRYKRKKTFEANKAMKASRFRRSSAFFDNASARLEICGREELDLDEERFSLEHRESYDRNFSAKCSTDMNMMRGSNSKLKVKTRKTIPISLQDGLNSFDSFTLTKSRLSELDGRYSFSNQYFPNGLFSQEVSLENNDEYKSWASKRKKKPKQWSSYEDEALLDLVSTQSNPIQWNIISQQLPFERSSKQCRERFLNNINPEVNKGPWTKAEDVVIINLYTIFGAQWVKMASCIPTRTDNGIKNRFHHLRRKMERDKEEIEKNGNICRVGKELQTKLNEKFKRKQQETKFQKKMSKIEGYTVAKVQSMLSLDSKLAQLYSTETNTSFRPAVPGEQCKRCFLFLPSKQCGEEICQLNGWCKTCSKVNTYMSRDSLYRCLWLLGETKNDKDVQGRIESKCVGWG